MALSGRHTLYFLGKTWTLRNHQTFFEILKFTTCNRQSLSMKLFLTSVFTLLSVTFSFGQLEKTIHQTFEIGDAATIDLDLYGTYEIIPWAGNNMMSETQIELYSASASILNHFVEKDQRYLIESDSTASNLTLRSHDKKRVAIRTRNGECFEIVHLKIFVPEKFYLENPTKLALK